jgi:4-amino-4-deoxy-L-arabinose transferase-like glycosyltransferase
MEVKMRLPSDESSLFRLAVVIVSAITIVRVIVLVATPLQLYPDEAQYWWWAQSLDWGYFSKPPLIAWIIWLTTRLGDPEWAIRLASPLLHAGTALVLFGIGRMTFEARTGFWSALAYATLPGISYSSGLISTDVPLLFCWAVALYAFLRALDNARWRWPVLCGVALSVGMLAKYAILYFILGASVAALLVPRARALVLSRRGAVVLLIGLLIVSPNLIWNAAHGFPTLAHTEANANWSRAKFDFGNALTFVIGQFGIFGPLMMAGWIAALWSPLFRDDERRESCWLLMAFSAPVLVLVIVQSFISDANANWAAPAFVTAVPLAVVVLLGWWQSWALWLSLGISAATLAGLWIVQIAPDAAPSGFSNALKRQEGWKEMGSAVAEAARGTPYDAIAAANRSVLAELLYYARPRSIPIRAWDRSAVPHDHFQMTIPLRPPTHRVLVVTEPREAPAILALFDSSRLVSTLKIPLGKHHSRVLELYDAHNFRGPQPAP